MGPVEVLVLSYPDAGLLRGIAPVLEELTRDGSFRIVDALVATQAPDGGVTVTDLEDDVIPRWSAISPHPRPLLSGSDAELIVGALAPGEIALVVAIEHVWAKSIASVVADSGGILQLHVRVRPDIVEAASLVDS
ncbi:hypothetical protein ABIE21_001182 [Conyzicola nivalis]|uniref:Uncharacterized protein n=1 Tax=Conyzicola nivalis TaxID=1477021 RepID=A0ABV2QL49_9MICO